MHVARLQTITDYKGKSSCVVPTDAYQPDELNILYALFEADNTEPSWRTVAAPDDQVSLVSSSECVLTSWRASSRMFNLSLFQAVASTCFKETTIRLGHHEALLEVGTGPHQDQNASIT
jgi:hypothetical protein